MKLMDDSQYYVYIVTNIDKAIFYTGITRELGLRLYQHEYEARHSAHNFAAKHGCIFLVYWEQLNNVREAMARERYMTELSTKRKEALITSFNPGWDFLNRNFSTAVPGFLIS